MEKKQIEQVDLDQLEPSNLPDSIFDLVDQINSEESKSLKEIYGIPPDPTIGSTMSGSILAHYPPTNAVFSGTINGGAFAISGVQKSIDFWDVYREIETLIKENQELKSEIKNIKDLLIKIESNTKK